MVAKRSFMEKTPQYGYGCKLGRMTVLAVMAWLGERNLASWQTTGQQLELYVTSVVAKTIAFPLAKSSAHQV